VDAAKPDASKVDGGNGNPNATEKAIGASCTCDKHPGYQIEYYGSCMTNLAALRANGTGCGRLDLGCVASWQTGAGTCQDTCTKDSECTGGKKCYQSSYMSPTGYWKFCQ
jgi:hypothetical protein